MLHKKIFPKPRTYLAWECLLRSTISHHKHKNMKKMSFPIRTIPSVLEFHQISLHSLKGHGLYHRSGISPCPKDLTVLTFFNGIIFMVQFQQQIQNFFVDRKRNLHVSCGNRSFLCAKSHFFCTKRVDFSFQKWKSKLMIVDNRFIL